MSPIKDWKSAAAVFGMSHAVATRQTLASLIGAARPADPGTPALRFDEVVVRFPSGRGQYTAVDRATFAVGHGEFVSVVGPTGCGKSTLLNLAAGLMSPSDGAVTSFGIPLAGTNRRATYLFQGDALMPWKTALDNIAIGLAYRGASASQAREQARPWLKRVGLAAFGDAYPHQMSGGMRKRVALAQTLILDPDILLMDEPFSALDVQTRLLMENELLELWAGNRKSVLFVTHDLEEAISLSDRVLVLSAGPGTRIIGDFSIPLARPRDVAEIRLAPDFLDLHRRIWDALKAEVLKGYSQTSQRLERA